MALTDCDVAIVGAGPYGLGAAARLKNAGVSSTMVFGKPMSFWDEMPVGMLLRSRWEASQIGYPEGDLSLDVFKQETGREFGTPVPLSDFVDYGRWFQEKAVPTIDESRVTNISANGSFKVELDSGKTVTAKRVVVAAGIGAFPSLPREFAKLPKELVSHTSEHRNLGVFAGRKVAIVGGGQSALESAALLHEAGAFPQVFARRSPIIWLKGGRYQKKLGRAKPILYAPTDVGPMGLSRLLAKPGLFTTLPRRLQDKLARRAIRPAGAKWLVPRLEDVDVRVGQSVISATPHADGLQLKLSDGSTRLVDHLLCGTGYKVDVSKYDFISPELIRNVKTSGTGFPLLRRGFESSEPGLFFLGAPASYSFGPILRFVSGSWFATEQLTKAIVEQGPSTSR